MAAKAKDIDWDKIEPGWKAGIKSPAVLANEYNSAKESGDDVTRDMIPKHFKRVGIERDLTEKINEKTKSIVTKSIVTSNVTKDNASDAQIIDANAQHASAILIGHKSSISRGRELSNALLLELEQQTISLDDFERLGDLMRSDDGIDRANEIYRKIISTPGRVDSLKKLSDTMKTFIGLERQALNINDNANGDANKPVVDKSDLSAADAYKAMLSQ